MLYLEIANHHPFSSLFNYRYLMIHGDFTLAWWDQPIVLLNEDEFSFGINERDKQGNYQSSTSINTWGEFIRMDPQAMWMVDEPLSHFYRLELCASSRLCVEPNSYGCDVKEEYLVDYRPLKLDGNQLRSFQRFEQIYNDEGGIGDCPFENWMIADFEVSNITAKRRGPLNLFQIQRFSKPIAEGEPRLYSDISLEDLLLEVLKMQPKETKDHKGLYDPDYGKKVRWSQELWYKPED